MDAADLPFQCDGAFIYPAAAGGYHAWGEVLCNPSGERDRAFGVSIFPDQNAVLAGLRRGNRRNQLLLVSRGDSV